MWHCLAKMPGDGVEWNGASYSTENCQSSFAIV